MSKKNPLAYNKLDKIKLQEYQKRNKVLLSKEYPKIKKLHEQGHSMRQLAELYQVSFGTIQKAINPEQVRQFNLRSSAKYREKQKAMYGKTKQTSDPMDLRRYKRQLAELGKLKIK